MLFERLALSKDTKAVMKMAKKDDIFAKYVIGGLSNRIFASKYKLALPSEKELTLKLGSMPELSGRGD
ncbi:MAG: hypothetical protein NTU90_00135 [Proteobacteria bacterium]|nr:hypothetical protein [Pseudomonadota bacterium]